MSDRTDLLTGWPHPERVALAVTDARRTLARTGPTTEVSRIASISKVVAGLTAMVAWEEGTLDLDAPAGPDGATVRHLLAHASGLAFDTDDVLAAVGTRRIYSNTGIERFADHLAERAGMSYSDYQHEAVIGPLGMTTTHLDGSPAYALHSNVEDLLLLARELLQPTLIDPTSLAEATRVQFPELRGVIPGLGQFDPNPWGLAIEIRGEKHPHWTAPAHSVRTFGHFGGTGTYLWVDPDRGLAAVAISGTDYGPWANAVWPVTNQAILDRFA